MTLSSDPVVERQQLRRLLRQQRRALSPAEQARAAKNLYLQVCQHPWFRRARQLAFYQANDGEISPHWLLEEALRRKKKVYLPVIAARGTPRMCFQQINSTTRWQRNRYGIVEPVADVRWQTPVWALDLVCMPLVGFDALGGRLGMGGGYYDRCLAASGMPLPALLGLAHGCQQVERIPLQAWDMPLDAVVSDRGWHHCRAGR